MAIGGIIGLALGVAAGTAIYWGLVSIPMRLLFRVTNWLVLLLAAGLASQAAAFLMQADLLPVFVRLIVMTPLETQPHSCLLRGRNQE
jgi:high-affinity iron transporter